MRIRRLTVLLAISLIVLPLRVRAQGASVGEATEDAAAVVLAEVAAVSTNSDSTRQESGQALGQVGEDAWFQAAPPTDDADWIQLKSGEWLRGHLVGLHAQELKFGSDRVDEEELKFKDVRRLFLRSPQIVVLTDLSSLRGRGMLLGDTLTLQTASGERAIERADILSIAPLVENEVDAWHLDASVGLSVSRGNVEQTVFNGSADLLREDEWMRLSAAYSASYGESKGRKIAHNHLGSARLDVYLLPSFFLTPLLASVEFNDFKNLRTRAAFTSGAGVRFLDGGEMYWDVAVGGGYQLVRFTSVTDDGDLTRSDLTFLVGTVFSFKVSDDVDVDTQYLVYFVATRPGLTHQQATAKVEVELTDLLDLELRAVYDRTERPVADEDGNVPKRNDLSLVVSLRIEYN